MSIKVPGILKNKYVLYILLLMSIINVLGYIAIEDYNSLALFVAVGLLSSYFSKNMAVNLLLAIVITSLIAVNRATREGMKGTNKKKTKKSTIKDKKSKCEEDSDCPKGKKCNAKGKCVTKSSFQNNVPPSSPAAVNEDSDDSVGDRIDYAATMEQAYDNLNKMLGEGGMKSLTTETKKLVSQQKNLMGTLSSMAPVLTNAKETLEGLKMGDMKEISNMFNKMKLPNSDKPDKIKNKA